MEQKKSKSLKRYLPYTHIGVFVLAIGYLAYFLAASYLGKDASAFSGAGVGSESDPYQITTCTQFQEIDQARYAKHYVVMNNIDCAESSEWNDGAGFQPIGSFDYGSIDGRNYTISNLNITNSTIDSVGVFRGLYASTLKNLNLDNGSVTNALDENTALTFTAGVVGRLGEDSVLSNVHSTLRVTGPSAVGGLVGWTDGRIENSFHIGQITSTLRGDAWIGGITAYMNHSNASIVNSFANTSISANSPDSDREYFCGGLVGVLNVGDLINSYAGPRDIDCKSAKTGISDQNAIGSLIASLVDNTNTITNNFSLAKIVQNGAHWTTYDTMVGVYYYNNQASDFSNNYYYMDTIAAPSDNLCSSWGDLQGCVRVDMEAYPDYFKDPNDSPVHVWDQESMWSINGDLPALKARPISPTGPRNLQANNNGTTSIALGWEAPENTYDQAVTTYNIQSKIVGEENEWNNFARDIDPAQEAVVTGLTPGKNYSFRVQAVTNVGAGLYSETAQASTQPEENPDLSYIDSLNTSSTPHSISIQWTAASNYQSLGDVKYKVRYVKWETDTWGAPTIPESSSENLGAIQPGEQGLVTTDVNAVFSDLPASSRYTVRVEAFYVTGGDTNHFIWTNAADVDTTSASYDVTTCQGIQNIKDDLAGQYSLKKDIDCTGFNFQPIGTLEGAQFSGTLEGNGYTIKNLSITSDAPITAMFTRTNGATIQNLKFSNPVVQINGVFGGALVVGQSYKSNFTQISVTNASITSTQGSSIGGIALLLGGRLSKSSISGTLNATITTKNEALSNNAVIGGLVAILSPSDEEEASPSTIERSSSSIAINVINNNDNDNHMAASGVGGIVGGAFAKTFVKNTYSTGSINVTTPSNASGADLLTVGGVAGALMNNETTGPGLERSYATGSVTVNDNKSSSRNIGGLVGLAGPHSSITNSFAVNQVQVSGGDSNTTSIGGIVGMLNRSDDENNDQATLEHLYYNQSVSGNSKCVGAAYSTSTSSLNNDYSNDECQKVNNLQSDYFFNNRNNAPLNVWDFRDIWRITPNGYPVLVSIKSSPVNNDNKIAITNCEELQAIRENLSGNYYLANDIDCQSTETWNPGLETDVEGSSGFTTGPSGFTPIGEAPNAFTGTFDGRNHSIKNLYSLQTVALPAEGEADTTPIRGIGLFGVVKGGKVNNLTLKDSTITTIGAAEAILDTQDGLGATFGNFLHNSTGGIIGTAALDTQLANLHVESSDITSTTGSAGAVIGTLIPKNVLTAQGLMQFFLPEPKSQTRVVLDNITSDGTVTGLIGGGAIGASLSGLNVSKNDNNAATLLIKNSSSSAKVLASVGGGLVGFNYSLGSDPVTYFAYQSLANGNIMDLIRGNYAISEDPDAEENPADEFERICGLPPEVFDEIREEISRNPEDPGDSDGLPPSVINVAIDQIDFYCGLAEGRVGYDFSVQGTRIENSSSNGTVTNCGPTALSQIEGFPQIGILGGVVGAGAGVEVRGSTTTGKIETCTNSTEDLPQVIPETSVTGGLAGFLMNSRIVNSNSSVTIRNNANNKFGTYAGASGGLVGAMFSLGNFDKKSVISNSHSSSTLDVDNARFTAGMAGGLVGGFFGSGTISSSYANGEVRGVLMESLDLPKIFSQDSEFADTNGPMGMIFNYLYNNPDEKIGGTFSGGLVGSSLGIDFPGALEQAAKAGNETLIHQIIGKDNLSDEQIESLAQNTKFSGDYDLGPSQGFTIDNSYADADVTGIFAGGLMGSSDMTADITKSYSSGNVRGMVAGGLISGTGLPAGAGSQMYGIFMPMLEGDISDSGNELMAYGQPLIRQLRLRDSYSKSSVTGVSLSIPLPENIDEIVGSASQEEGDYPDRLSEYDFPSEVGIPSITGGIAGFYSPVGGSTKNVYSSGVISTAKRPEPIVRDGKQGKSFFPPDITGGLYGLNLANNEINIDRTDTTTKRPASIKNSFSASKFKLRNKAINGAYAGTIYNPGIVSALVSNSQYDKSQLPFLQEVNGIYYDKERGTQEICSGDPLENKQIALTVGQLFAGPELELDDIPDIAFEQFMQYNGCNAVNTNSSDPNYFINNTANAPMDTWDFTNTWRTNINDYPDFIGSKLPNGGNEDTTNGTPIKKVNPVPVFGFTSIAQTPVIELANVPKIGASPFALTGVLARILQALPWVLLLILGLLYLYQAWTQNQANKRFRNAIELSKRVKQSLGSYLSLTSHYLATPTTTIKTSLELITGLKEVSPEKGASLTKTAKELAAYVNELTATSQKLAEKTESKLMIQAKELSPTVLRRWVVLPVAAASLILTVSLTVLARFDIWQVTTVSLILNIFMIVLAGALVFFSFKIRENQRTINAALNQALSAEKALVEERKDFITAAQSKLTIFAHDLELGSKSLEKSKHAKPYLSGLADLKIVTDSFSKLYKFSTTNLPYPSEITSAIVKALTPQRLDAKVRHIDLQTFMPPTVSTVLSLDETEHIVTTLVDNAMKFSAEGAVVVFDVSQDDKNTTIKVIDHGVGIDPEKVKTLMQPFARGTDFEKFNYEGIGLDLYITRIVAEKYGGSVSINSKIDEGTQVSVVIPSK